MRVTCRAGGPEAGFTVAELTMAVSLLVTLVAIFGTLLTSTMGAASDLEEESRAVDALRTTLASIEREVRSAECVSTPADGGQGSTLSLTTWAGGSRRHVNYEIDDDGALTRQRDGATATVAEHLVDTDEAFSYAAPTASDPRGRVDVRLAIRLDTDRSARSVETTVTGRNVVVTC